MWLKKRIPAAGLAVAAWLLATGYLRAAEDTPLPQLQSPRALGYVLPEGWTRMPSDSAKGIYAFQTAQSHDVGLGASWPAHETALEWAVDELTAVEREWSQPMLLQDGITVGAFQLVAPPTEQTIGSKTWATIAWEVPLTYQGRIVRRRTEQYFWRDGDTIVQVLLAYPAEHAEQLERTKVEQFLSSIHLAPPQAAATKAWDGFLPPEQVKRQVFASPGLGFSFEGPPGWSSLTQGVDEAGKPLYDLPPDVRHLSKKWYGAEAPPAGLPSWIELHIGVPAEPPMAALQRSLEGVPLEDLVTAPTEALLGERTWAVVEHRLTSSVGGQSVPLMRRLYFTEHRGTLIGISGTSPTEEYQEDRSLFDTEVSKMWFGEPNDLLSHVLKETVEESLVKPDESEKR